MVDQSTSADFAVAGADHRLDRGLIMIASVVVIGAVMTILDITVVNVAITTIAREFDTSLSTIQWVTTGYTLALATVIPLTGWASDRFGTKRLYLTSITLFVAGSVLSGLATSAHTLIAFRVLQGLGGGMLMPAGMTILTRAAGPHRLGRIMAIVGVPLMLGPVLGPIIGGVLVDSLSWRWIFFVNVPVGIVGLVMSWKVLEADVPKPGHRLDWLGLAFLSPGLALLIYGLAESASAGGLGATKVWGTMLAGAALLLLFARHSLRNPDDALIDLRLFGNRVFAPSIGTLLLVVVPVFGTLLLLPLYFQTVRFESALDTGLLMAPLGLGEMMTLPIAGKLADRIGIGRIVPVGLLIISLGFVSLTQLEADTSFWLTGATLFVMGMGMGATIMPCFTGALQTLRRSAISRATTAININQQIASSIGTALMSVLLAHELTSRLGHTGAIGELVSPGQRALAAPLMADAFAATFVWALVLIVAAFAVALVFLPKRKPAAPEEPGDAAVPPDAAVALIH